MREISSRPEDFAGLLPDGADRGPDGLLDVVPQDDGVRAGGHVLESLVHDLLGQDEASVVPSPATSFVLVAISKKIWLPWFSKASSRSI